MSILFGILFFLNVMNPEHQEFVSKTLDNNKHYNCEFKYKGLSPATDRPAISVYGYTIFKQVCSK